MNLYRRIYHNVLLQPTSWKNAARLNCFILGLFIFPLLGLTILSSVKSTNRSQFFMLPARPCKSVSKMNKGLHLVLNMLSSLILASSNFFMQILNAPSRSEIERAHRKGTWLEIGVPSIRNTFQVSWVKTFLWIVLFLSSIPLHLIFNSAVFQVDKISGDFEMTVASEAFLRGTSFFVPGASLWKPWLYPFNWAYWTADIDRAVKPSPESLAAYLKNASAAINKNVLDQHPEKNWKRLNATDCYRQYADYKCNGIRSHKDVLVILREPVGWTRNETWSSDTNQTAVWDFAIPNNQHNSLWFFSNCTMSTRGYAGNSCRSNCLSNGGNASNPRSWITDNLEFDRWFHDAHNYPSYYGGTLEVDHTRLQVSHCLAEPLQQTCRIGISTRLLLVVLICVVVKAIAALAVTWTLSHQPDESLVTIGDALASFIRNPDSNTRGSCICDQKEAKTIFKTLPRRNTVPDPQKWHKPRRRLGSFVKRSVWATSYALIGFGIVFAVGWVVFGSGTFSGPPVFYGM